MRKNNQWIKSVKINEKENKDSNREQGGKRPMNRNTEK